MPFGNSVIVNTDNIRNSILFLANNELVETVGEYFAVCHLCLGYNEVLVVNRPNKKTQKNVNEEQF